MMEESEAGLPSVACAMQEFESFLSKRAFEEGKAAFTAGSCRTPPSRLGTFSGKWVEGWFDAYYASLDFSKGVERGKALTETLVPGSP